MTDAGMQLDRAGGGAASGEEERLPGRFSLFSFFYKRKREVTSIQKAVADRQLHGRKQQEQRKHRGCRKHPRIRGSRILHVTLSGASPPSPKLIVIA